jgi:hypothetical protein
MSLAQDFTTTVTNNNFTLPAGFKQISVKNDGANPATFIGTINIVGAVSTPVTLNAGEIYTWDYNGEGHGAITFSAPATTIKIVATQ